MQEYHEPVRCRKCGGRCCKIYLSRSEGGTFPDDELVLLQWHAYFHENKGDYGVEPLFNPLEVHALGNEQMLEELRKEGIDPYYCEYIGDDGCRIPWPKRPERCKGYRCLEWIRNETR